MIINPAIGMRVKFYRPDLRFNHELQNQLGTITSITISHSTTHTIVRFDRLLVSVPQALSCSLEYLHHVFMSPEEEAIHQEQMRQEEEQRLDQARRKAHADKYL